MRHRAVLRLAARPRVCIVAYMERMVHTSASCGAMRRRYMFLTVMFIVAMLLLYAGYAPLHQLAVDFDALKDEVHAWQERSLLRLIYWFPFADVVITGAFWLKCTHTDTRMWETAVRKSVRAHGT